MALIDVNPTIIIEDWEVDFREVYGKYIYSLDKGLKAEDGDHKPLLDF